METMTETTGMEEKIKKAISFYADGQKERIIKEAAAEFEKAVREACGRVAIMVSEYYSIERTGNQLIIKVEIGPDKH
jgi:hypothetical protein